MTRSEKIKLLKDFQQGRIKLESIVKSNEGVLFMKEGQAYAYQLNGIFELIEGSTEHLKPTHIIEFEDYSTIANNNKIQ